MSRWKAGSEKFGLISFDIDRKGDNPDENPLARVLREKHDEERGGEQDLDVQWGPANDFNKSVPDSSNDILRAIPEQGEDDQQPPCDLAPRRRLRPLPFLHGDRSRH